MLRSSSAQDDVLPRPLAHKATCRKTSVPTGHLATRQQHPLDLTAVSSFQIPLPNF